MGRSAKTKITTSPEADLFESNIDQASNPIWTTGVYQPHRLPDLKGPHNLLPGLLPGRFSAKDIPPITDIQDPLKVPFPRYGGKNMSPSKAVKPTTVFACYLMIAMSPAGELTLKEIVGMAIEWCPLLEKKTGGDPTQTFRAALHDRELFENSAGKHRIKALEDESTAAGSAAVATTTDDDDHVGIMAVTEADGLRTPPTSSSPPAIAAPTTPTTSPSAFVNAYASSTTSSDEADVADALLQLSRGLDVSPTPPTPSRTAPTLSEVSPAPSTIPPTPSKAPPTPSQTDKSKSKKRKRLPDHPTPASKAADKKKRKKVSPPTTPDARPVQRLILRTSSWNPINGNPSYRSLSRESEGKKEVTVD